MQRAALMSNRRFHVACIVLILVAGQAFAFRKRGQRLWPFSPIRVYTKFPEDDRSACQRIAAVTDDGETDVVRVPGVNFRLVLRYAAEYKRAPSGTRKDRALEWLCQNVDRRNPEFGCRGVRVYAVELDFSTNSRIDTLAYEYQRK